MQFVSIAVCRFITAFAVRSNLTIVSMRRSIRTAWFWSTLMRRKRNRPKSFNPNWIAHQDRWFFRAFFQVFPICKTVRCSLKLDFSHFSQTTRRVSRMQSHVNHLTAQQVKQVFALKHSQKLHDKKNRQQMCRNAMERGNKVREANCKGGRQKRSDMTHCKVISRANNNRKC